MTWAADALRAAGCVAAEEEARLLSTAAADDDEVLHALVERRSTGEPLAWILGHTTFCGEQVRIEPGVYVPRAQTEPLAEAAAALLPHRGTLVDLCTGAGAIAVVAGHRRPEARVIGTDLDPVAVRCARANGVDARLSDLAEGLDPDLAGTVDVVTAVVPYVPTDALALLPRDVVAYEPRRALDGGPDGTALLERAVTAAAHLLRAGGWLLLELGADQPERLGPALSAAGFGEVRIERDEDGDVRSLTGRRT